MNCNHKTDIETNSGTIADVLFNKRFVIPRHQRPYAWDKEHIKWLLDDIADGIEKDRPYHYLGHAMFIPNNNELEINDGQQRIVTITLICAYLLYEHFASTKDTLSINNAMRILFDFPPYPKKTLDDIDTLEPRITLSTNDHLAYKFIISGKSNFSENNKMTLAWITIEKFFAKTSSEFKESFLEFMLYKLKVSWTDLGNEGDAITSFVTQNTRGKQLEQIQLTCTYFHRRLRDRPKQNKDIQVLFSNIRSAFNGNEDEFFNYTRCFAHCEHGHLSKKRFCLDLSGKINDPTEAYQFVCRLSDENKINIFKNINKHPPDESDYKNLISDAGKTKSYITITDHLWDFHKYESVSNAIIFSLIRQYQDTSDPTKKKKVAKFVWNSIELFASFVQRAAHPTDSFTTSRYENKVAALAKAISNLECTTPEEFFSSLEGLDIDNIIPDDSYQDKMASVTFRPKSLNAKNILIRINKYKSVQGTSGKNARGTSVDRSQTSVEHILPQSSNHLAGWHPFKKQDHKTYRYWLGNLTLLPDDPIFGRDAFNANLSAKEPYYKASKYVITQELITEELARLENPGEWDVKSIKHRQARLASDAAQVWNFTIDNNPKKSGKKP